MLHLLMYFGCSKAKCRKYLSNWSKKHTSMSVSHNPSNAICFAPIFTQTLINGRFTSNFILFRFNLYINGISYVVLGSRPFWLWSLWLYIEQIFSTFLHSEYGGPGTLLVIPFIDMADAVKERGLAGGPAARVAIKWAENHVDKDWKQWNDGDSK